MKKKLSRLFRKWANKLSPEYRMPTILEVNNTDLREVSFERIINEAELCREMIRWRGLKSESQALEEFIGKMKCDMVKETMYNIAEKMIEFIEEPCRMPRMRLCCRFWVLDK